MSHMVSHALRHVAMAKIPPRNPLIMVLGATGTGKSQLAVDLAKQFNGEIINGDAMQMYDGLPIITNKIPVVEQQGIPHHLLGFIKLDEEPWVVGMFRKKASEIIQEIRSRGRLPIVVGGTHYYTQSLLFKHSLVNQDEIEDVQTMLSNEEISARFPILDGPTEPMIEKLREVDPTMADRWHPKDRRKIRRSLEIFLLSGRKASEIYAEMNAAKDMKALSNPILSGEAGQPLTETLLFWLHADSEILKLRLDKRVDTMLEAGLLDEVESLNQHIDKQKASGITVDQSRGIWASIGWKEFEPYLASLKDDVVSEQSVTDLYGLCVEQTKVATRQYAKRQIRWIRLKLIPALHNQGALSQLYLLDGSDLDLWTQEVLKPALETTQEFLFGHELHSPLELSETASRLLTLEETMSSSSLPIIQECEMCSTTCAGEDQWEAHIKSRRHRALLKKRQRNPNGGELRENVNNTVYLPPTGFQPGLSV